MGFDSHVLRFAARLIDDNPVNRRRYFIIKYFLCDDTIGIFELGERNSGFTVRTVNICKGLFVDKFGIRVNECFLI